MTDSAAHYGIPDLYHALTWPELSYVAVNPKGQVVGYILAKMYVSAEHALLFKHSRDGPQRFRMMGYEMLKDLCYITTGTRTQLTFHQAMLPLSPSFDRIEDWVLQPGSCVRAVSTTLICARDWTDANVDWIRLWNIEHAMVNLYKAHHITLHVRESNKPAISLYKDNLGFEQTGVEKAYCKLCAFVDSFLQRLLTPMVA